MRRLAAALLLSALPTAMMAGQQPQPTFRAGVELVQIDTVVVDAAGNPVAGLTAEDFEIREQGQPQRIVAFAPVDIPIERLERPLFSPTAIEPDVTSNSGGEGRIYLIALDDIRADLALRTRRFLRRFIETQMGANDVAAIAYLGKGAGNSQDFTSNKRLLLTQLDKFGGMFSGDHDDTQGRMKTFRDITEFLASIHGRRKAMLLISTGGTLFDAYDIVDYRGGTTSIDADEAREAMIAATRGNVVIYPVNPQGLTADGGTGDGEEGPTAEAAQSARLGAMQSTGNLRALAEVTGGFAFVNQNNFADAFTRIVRENSSYYILGYYSDNEKRDGRFRSVDVRVKRPGLQVRARTGYVAPTGRSKPMAPARSVLVAEVSEALASPIARQDIGLKLFAAPYKGTRKEATVAIVLQVDPSQLRLVEQNGTFNGELEVAVSPTSGRKVLKGVFHVMKVALKPETMKAAERDGLRIVTDLPLAAGQYQIRVAAGNRNGRAGSIVADLTVPDFTKGPLVFSGVSLGSARLPRTLTVRAGTAIAPTPVLPTTSREFNASETIELFVEVYDNIKSAHTVDLVATLRADDGRVLKTVTEQRSSSELKGAAGGFGFKADLPLAGVTPGLYVVHVEARANTGDRRAVARDVMITVR
jgi:VWFA-related protein